MINRTNGLWAIYKQYEGSAYFLGVILPRMSRYEVKMTAGKSELGSFGAKLSEASVQLLIWIFSSLLSLSLLLNCLLPYCILYLE
jgi:hypothetical protein